VAVLGREVQRGRVLAMSGPAVDAVAAGRPRQRLVDDLLRVVGWPPGREAAVRPVEPALRPRLERQAPVAPDELVDQVEPAQPGGGARVARVQAVLGEQLGGRAVAPEQRDASLNR
jgi:hypothetical protein